MRGQAIVELALGLLVFVTVLIFGIAFSETGFLSMKVHEAATAALWDTTAKPLHAHPNRWQPRNRAVAEAGPEATSLYAGFDGREGKRGARRNQQVLVSGEDLLVSCEREALINTSAARWEPFPGGEGGMRCTASASLAFARVPTRFAEGSGGFFRLPHFDRARGLPVCALGRPRQGRCGAGGYAVLLDTWGLRGDDETRSCSFAGCDNPPYAGVVQGLYDQLEPRAGPTSASAFAGAVVGARPGQPSRTFRFSFWDQSGDPGYTPGDGDEGQRQGWMMNVRSGSRNPRYQDRGGRLFGGDRPR